SMINNKNILPAKRWRKVRKIQLNRTKCYRRVCHQLPQPHGGASHNQIFQNISDNMIIICNLTDFVSLHYVNAYNGRGKCSNLKKLGTRIRKNLAQMLMLLAP